jgi:hypothetical protein
MNGVRNLKMHSNIPWRKQKNIARHGIPVPEEDQLHSRWQISPQRWGEAFPRPYHLHQPHQAHLQAAVEEGVQVAVVAAEAEAAGKPSTNQGINKDSGCISSSLRNINYIFYALL